MKINPLNAIDFYKAGHHRQYPLGTELVYSNFTARSGKLRNLPQDADDGVVFFGLQYFILSFLDEIFNENFFERGKDFAVQDYKEMLDTCLGGDHDVSHIEALYDLGYLPIEIRAIPEGTLVPYRIPLMTIHNTKPEFFWLTNYLESVMSCMLWKSCTSATIARYYRQQLEKYAKETCDDMSLVPFQAHDFSFRGMSGMEDAAMSGAAHLTAFSGTDTVLAIDLIKQYYTVDDTPSFIGGSVPATEHSVMCMGTQDSEFETFKRLITETYPSGIVSIVSDTWDLWKVLTDYMPRLKKEILARDGKVVIRPDSGDPVKIVCGDPMKNQHLEDGSHHSEFLGVIELLDNTFESTKNSKGYYQLNPKVGCIYGDSITPERCNQILKTLKEKSFATNCIVFGVGSYTYTYATRDTHGFAVKATFGCVNGQNRIIQKDPVTDDGIKKSLRGMVSVHRSDDNRLIVVDGLDHQDETSLLEVVYRDGELVKFQTIEEIREKVSKGL